MKHKKAENKAKEIQRLLAIQNKYGITEKMLLEAEADLNPRRLFAKKQPTKK